MFSPNVKKSFLLSVASLICFSAYADLYQIKKITYEISGSTKEYALRTKVPVDKKKIFSNEDELMTYINDYKKRLENTRAFEKIQVDFSLEESDIGKKENEIKIEDGITGEGENAPIEKEDENEVPREEEKFYFVNLNVSTSDSLHFLLMPYPKYDSNSGFTLKLKTKDSNFFGTLETMSGDLNFAIVSKDETKYDYKFGLDMNFEVPFKLGIFDSVWMNDYNISYTIGKNTPEWNFKTGLELSLPFERFSVKLDFYQSFIRNLDYEDADVNGTNVHYGDGTYFVEEAKFSVPIVIQKIKNWGNIYYTPYFNGKFNWDTDGISNLNEDLMSPVLSLGQTFSTSRIDWIGNFRNGVSVSLTQSFSYNVQKLDFIPGISGELKFFKAFKYLGISADAYVFAYLNGNSSFGERLRGIRDEQYYSTASTAADKKACESPAAVVLNFDFPVRIFLAKWDEMSFMQKVPRIKKIAKYFNMEFHLSPFLDIALYRNKATGLNFDYRDGFYAAGIEAIVYPLKWKGMVVRGSFGLDLSQTMPGLKGKLNQDWRNSKPYEISIGIGLHY